MKLQPGGELGVRRELILILEDEGRALIARRILHERERFGKYLVLDAIPIVPAAGVTHRRLPEGGSIAPILKLGNWFLSVPRIRSWDTAIALKPASNAFAGGWVDRTLYFANRSWSNW